MVSVSAKKASKRKKVRRFKAGWSDAHNHTPAGTQIAHRETKGAQREALPKGRSSDALLLVGEEHSQDRK